MAESEAAFQRALALDDHQRPAIHAMRVLAQMKQGLGDHWAAIRVLSDAIDMDNNPERIQCLFLRGKAADCFFATHKSGFVRAVCCTLQSILCTDSKPFACYI